ncbi:MAG: AAA family ATPase [Candidatus Thorarchaeota archaeon]
MQRVATLTSPDGTIEYVKGEKKVFVSKHSLKSSEIFTLPEIAMDSLKYLIETRRIKNVEELRKARISSPFLSKYITHKRTNELERLLGSQESSILTKEDLSRLSQEDFLRRKTEELTEEAKKKAEIELEEERKRIQELKIQAEKELEVVRMATSELEELPTAIDPEEYIKESEEPVKPTEEVGMLWWQRLGLSGDPFPTKLGLSRIPIEKYEDVVVKTEIFGQYLQILSKNPRELFGKTILISGQFGSGKTTFLQYLAYKLTPHEILPIQAILDPVDDADLIRQNLYSEILSEVSTAYRNRGLSDPLTSGSEFNKDTIVTLMSYLATQSKLAGFVLTIDGLHKAETTLDSSLEFVKQLQNFHESLDSRGINLSILIAGSPLWLRQITRNPAHSGSFFRIDQVPSLSPQGAFSLLEKRIKAYASQDSVQIFFDRAAIEFAYKFLAEESKEYVTFRSFIDYILPRLEKGDFKDAGISVAIDIETVQKVGTLLDMSPIGPAYQLFRTSTAGKSRLRRAMSHVLRHIYKHSHTLESEGIFRGNKGAFLVLRDSHFIERVRSRHGEHGWGMSKDFLAALENLNELGYPPEIVFRALSMEPGEKEEADRTKLDPTLNMAQDFLAKWEAEWPEMSNQIKSFIVNHQEILGSYGAPAEKLCKYCTTAIEEMVSACQVVFGTQKEADEWVRSTWVDLPVPEITSILSKTISREGEKFEYLQRYHQSAKALLEGLDTVLRVNRIVNVISSKNGNEELKWLMSAGALFEEGDLAGAIDKVNTILEKAIRSTFHLAFSLHYGPNHTKRLPPHVQDRIDKATYRGPELLRRDADVNLFYHFSRGEYAEIIDRKMYWESIFRPIFSPRSRKEIVAALRRTFSLDDRRAHRDRPAYFRKVREEIRASISAADWILESLGRTYLFATTPLQIDRRTEDSNHFVKISFGDDRSSQWWELPDERLREISARIVRYKSTIDLSVDSNIPPIFGCTVSELCATIMTLINERKIAVNFVEGSNSKIKILRIENNPPLNQ